MAPRRQSLRCAVLAEDKTDCDVIRAIIKRERPEYGVDDYAAKGASELDRKVIPHVARFVAAGCRALIIVRDLDRDKDTKQLNDRDALLALLSAREYPPGAEVRLFCIPIEELEAWFWADQNVIDHVSGDKPGKASHQPSAIEDPKGELRRISKRGGKARYSTNENAALAERLDIRTCMERCPEFAELVHFIRRLPGPSAESST